MNNPESIESQKLAVDFQKSNAFEVTISGSKFSLSGSLIRNVAVNKVQRCTPRARLLDARI